MAVLVLVLRVAVVVPTGKNYFILLAPPFKSNIDKYIANAIEYAIKIK